MQGKRGQFSLFTILIEILLLSTGIGFAAFAQTPNDPQTTTTTTVDVKQKPWSFNIELNITGGFTEVEQASYIENRIGGSWVWTPQLTSNLSFGWQEAFTPNTEFAIQDTFLTQTIQLGRIPGHINFLLSVRLTAPTSKPSRDASLITAIRPTLSLSKSFWKERLSLAPSLSGTLNFHRHEFALQNKPGQRQNVQLALRPGIEGCIAYANVSLSTAWAYILSRTYQGSIRHNFAASLEGGYSFSKNLYVGVGVSNEGSTTRNGGRNSNVTLFEQDTTEIFATTKLSF